MRTGDMEGGTGRGPLIHLKRDTENLKMGILSRKRMRTHLQTIHILESGFSHCKSDICVFLVVILVLLVYLKTTPGSYEIQPIWI